MFTDIQRVYYEHTDHGGVVYHANYLSFLERARTEWLRKLGYDQSYLQKEYDIGFIIRDINIQFIMPAKLDDLLNITVDLNALRGATLLVDQKIERDQSLLCSADVKLVCIKASSFKPCPIPDFIQQEITNAH